MARYRLRFLLQEIDLAQGDTLLGRSAGCHVTIEDPLVSRQHARISVWSDRATIEDLGSRNGSMVNGRLVEGMQELADGDRIRIGTQEFVFCRVTGSPSRKAGPTTRPTGFMCNCAGCGLPYPAELLVCPSCGSRDRLDEDTLSGVNEAQRDWTLELLVEVLAKALSLSRWNDVERTLRRIRANVEERIAKGKTVERSHLDRLAEAAAGLAVERKQAEWGAWLLVVHAELGWVPHPGITRSLSTLPPAERASLAPAAERVLERARAEGLPPDVDGLSDVRKLSGAGASEAK